MIITVISNFPSNDIALNGQTIKALFLIDALKMYGYDVSVVDYSEYKKRPFGTLFYFVKNVRKADSIIILPDKGALKFLVKWCLIIKKKNAKLFYDVVGGWLPSFIENKQQLIKKIKKFDGIWVENADMVHNLSKLGVNNSKVIKNFKFYNQQIHFPNYNDFKEKIGKFVFLSRIDPDKGIFEAINAVISVYKEGYPIHLDVYGPIKNICKDRFENVLKYNGDCISYMGTIDPKSANKILSHYYMQFFLTKLPTEGVPGSIIDSFAAGVPVLYTSWNANFNMIIDGQTGFKTELNDEQKVVDLIKFSINHPFDIYQMSRNCYDEFRKKYDFHTDFKFIDEELKR